MYVPTDVFEKLNLDFLEILIFLPVIEIKKSVIQFLKCIGRYMHVNFQLSKLIFVGGDRFLQRKLDSKIAIF